MYILNHNDYYDVILKDSSIHKSTIEINSIPILAQKVYLWINDFTGRRGFRQNWESYFSEEEQETLMNNVYGKFYNEKEINLESMEFLLDILKSVPGNSQTIDEIDDDIMLEIKESWIDIFN